MALDEVINIKGRFIHYLSSFVCFIPLLIIFGFPSKTSLEKSAFITVIAIISLIAVFMLYKRIRLIEDTATTDLNSAAQGYMALSGTVSLYEGEIVRAPKLELPPMIWYRNITSESWSGFIINDEKGRCTVDPSGAEIITPRYYKCEHFFNAIYPGEMVYVIGELHTLSKHRNDYERNALVLSKLKEWKQNPSQFLDYFDEDKDGRICEGELQKAKDAATNFIDEELEQVYQDPATHVVSKPEDGRPFILTSIHPDQLLKRYKRALLLHFLVWAILSLYIVFG